MKNFGCPELLHSCRTLVTREQQVMAGRRSTVITIKIIMAIRGTATLHPKKDIYIKYTKLMLIVTACVFSSHTLAFGGISADEVRTLFAGNTVEGERRAGGVPGVDAPNKIEDHATAFIAYFDKKGTVKKKTGGKPKLGKWSVTSNGKLCITWKGKKEKCAPVYKEGKIYKRVIERKSGFVLMELTYIRFTPGNEYNL